MPAGTVNRDGQQDVIDHLTTSNKIPNPAIPMVASNYWTSIAALRDASDPPTLRKVQEEIARTPRLLMALNYNALRDMVGLAVQRNELVIHSAQGMLIADAALMKDDAVIYIAGNEPSVPNATPCRRSRTRTKATTPSHLLALQDRVPTAKPDSTKPAHALIKWWQTLTPSWRGTSMSPAILRTSQ